MGPTSEVWLEAARRHGAVIVAGICERAGDALYNSAAIVGPDGFIGIYRKVRLWGAENLFFEPCDLGVPVWKTEFGRMAVAICYDGWFPETYRLAGCKVQTFFACQPTGFPCQTSPRTR
jgi:N-carbamoylputrescine amidase